MNSDVELLKKRFSELARRASGGGYFTFTDFLGLLEQSTFNEIKRSIPTEYEIFGGFEGAERIMIRFGSEEEIGYTAPFPIKTLLIKPKAERFAEKLSHRDYLGSLMNLGIERECLGDIVILENRAYLFAEEEIAPFIISSLERVRNTDVTVEECVLDGEFVPFKTETRQIQISSERLDAVIAKTFHLSRDDAQMLFRRGLVFVDGRLIESVSHTPRMGDRITVRTLGRIRYGGVVGTSKKGKLNVTVEVYS